METRKVIVVVVVYNLPAVDMTLRSTSTATATTTKDWPGKGADLATSCELRAVIGTLDELGQLPVAGCAESQLSDWPAAATYRHGRSNHRLPISVNGLQMSSSGSGRASLGQPN